MPETSPRLPIEIDDTIDPSLVTGRGGVPLVIELFRQLGVAATVDAQVRVKQRQRGLPPSQLVESLIALWVSGGDRCQDLTTLREDEALATLLGYPLPAATTARDFLEAFHVEGGPLSRGTLVLKQLVTSELLRLLPEKRYRTACHGYAGTRRWKSDSGQGTRGQRSAVRDQRAARTIAGLRSMSHKP